MKALHRAHALYAREAATAGDDDSALIRRHSQMIDRCARQLCNRIGSQDAFGDLWSAGALGLLDAAGRFEEGRGARFETFAEHRIRGAMLDELRRLDHLPRRLRADTEKVATARRKIEGELGRPAEEAEVAAALDMEISEMHELEALTHPLLPMEALGDPGELPSQEEHASRTQLLGQIAEHIAELPERQRVVLSLHYVESLTYREIAAVLGVSEPRVCQIHSEAVGHLRRAMAE